MAKPKILFVANRAEFFASHRIAWLRGAQEAGFDVHVTTLTDGGDPPIDS